MLFDPDCFETQIINLCMASAQTLPKIIAHMYYHWHGAEPGALITIDGDPSNAVFAVEAQGETLIRVVWSEQRRMRRRTHGMVVVEGAVTRFLNRYDLSDHIHIEYAVCYDATNLDPSTRVPSITYTLVTPATHDTFEDYRRSVLLFPDVRRKR